MTTKLFDAFAGFGGRRAGERNAVTADAFLSELGRLSIERALVRVAPEDLDLDVKKSNRTLYDACLRNPVLTPCPVAVPNTAGDLPSEEEQVDDAIRHGAGAVCLRPARDSWVAAEWACGRLLGAAESRRLPAFCLEGFVPAKDVAVLAGAHPALTILLAGLTYRSVRTHLALLQAFPNVCLVMGGAYAVWALLEHVVRTAGASRLLFGTGFPGSSPAAAVTQLMYADIGEPERQLIAADNMTALMEQIVR